MSAGISLPSKSNACTAKLSGSGGILGTRFRLYDWHDMSYMYIKNDIHIHTYTNIYIYTQTHRSPESSSLHVYVCVCHGTYMRRLQPSAAARNQSSPARETWEPIRPYGALGEAPVHVRYQARMWTHTHTHIICIYIYVCVCA